MIVGFNFNTISGKINDSKIGSGGISVNSRPEIISIEKADVLDMKDVLRISFSFTTKYEADIGEILFEGSLLWRNPDAKRVLKMWEEEKKFEAKAGVEVMNTVFRKCLAKAVVLADDLRLPPPVQFPIVRSESEDGKSGKD